MTDIVEVTQADQVLRNEIIAYVVAGEGVAETEAQIDNLIARYRIASVQPPQSHIAELEAVAATASDKLSAFVGALADVTDCSGDVEALVSLNALLSPGVTTVFRAMNPTPPEQAE